MPATSTPADRRPLGRTGLPVSPVCIGTSPLASMPALYGYEVAQERAEATIRATLGGPFNFLDTSNNYGGGSAEERIGHVLAAAGGVPPGFVLATKADADPVTGDFSGDRVRRSVEESLGRLGLDRVQLMYLHDPEYHLTFAEAMADGGPVAALTKLRAEGVLGHLGVAGGPVALMSEFVATGVFDVVLSHNRFTLIDRSAGQLMDEARQRGVAFVNGPPMGAASWPRVPTPSPGTPTGRPARRCSARCDPCSRPAPGTACPWPRPRCSSRCASRGSPPRSWACPSRPGSARSAT
jgi:D-threo-aldose 1-dehydrogenase